jgi:tRNA dimethylallyltransferase
VNISKPSNSYDGPVIVIVGPTASGKTGAAIELAKKIGGEVISADSRAIYKYMDIGTAKPSKEEMDGVPHFGIDLVEPGERFTVADFKAYAEQKIAEIRERGHVPIVAGGTGLYVDALVYNYHFNETVQKSYADRQEMEKGYTIFGIKWDMDKLRERLTIRERQLYCEDLFKETKFLVEKYGWDSQAMKSNIYQFAWKYMQGELSLEEAIEQNVYDDYHLAKRQMTWFKRNDNIIWLPLEQIVAEACKIVAQS